MSAYICNPEHIGLLAAYAIVGAEDRFPLDYVIAKLRNPRQSLEENAATVAECLTRENIRSVQHRYPDDVDGKLPGPGLLNEDIVTLARVWGRQYRSAFPKYISPVAILKLVNSLSYQSCETDDWENTAAFDQLERIKDLAISNLDGYDEAPWTVYSEDTPPEIKAFYDTLEKQP